MKKSEEEVNKGLKTLAKGSFIVFIGIFFAKIFSIGYRIIIARSLDPELYGLFSLALLVSGLLVIFSKFGLTGGVLRFIPFFRGKDRPDKAEYIFKFSLGVLSLSSIAVGILLFIFSESIAVGIFGNPGLTFFLQIFSITIPLTIILDLFLSVILAFEKVEWHSFIYNILLNFVKIVSLVVLVILGFTVNAIVFSYLLGIAVSLIAAYFVVRKIMMNFVVKKEPSEEEKKDSRRKLFSYSWPLLFFGFTWQIFHWTDSFLIGYFRGAVEVGFYNAAIPIAMLFNLTSALFIQLFFPYVTKAYSKSGKTEVIKELSKQVGKWIFIINLPLLLLMLLFPGAFIDLLFGEQYLAAENALRLLAVGMLINSVFIVSDRLISMIGKTKVILIDILAVSAINIVLNIIFIQKYGITGAALSTMISFIILNLLFVVQSKYYLSIIPIRRKMLMVSVAGAISISVVYYLRGLVETGILSLIVLSSLFILLYILLVFLIGGLDRNDFMIIRSLRKKIAS